MLHLRQHVFRGSTKIELSESFLVVYEGNPNITQKRIPAETRKLVMSLLLSTCRHFRIRPPCRAPFPFTNFPCQQYQRQGQPFPTHYGFLLSTFLPLRLALPFRPRKVHLNLPHVGHCAAHITTIVETMLSANACP